MAQFSDDVSEYEKYFPVGFSLETERVKLVPMQKEDIPDFESISQYDILWKYFTKELNDPEQLTQWVEDAITERQAEKRVPFTIRDKKSDAVCGSTSFGSLSFFDKRIEIGWSWLGEVYLGSGINKHCKFALLQYAFEIMKFERVEIKTDNLNERAKQALRKIGAIEEGVLRSHMLMPHGRRRNSVYFSVLQSEWPEVKKQYFNEIK